tara:strand:+ start:256 stop:813 length:558 start_codon:yes stop_codon:yes gene_type:complete
LAVFVGPIQTYFNNKTSGSTQMTVALNAFNTSPAIVQPMRVVEGSRMMLRAAQRLVGSAMTLAAIGLWVMPGASFEQDVMLFKLVLSITAFISGLALIHASSAPDAPDVEVDMSAQEVRLVRTLSGKQPVVLQTCTFAELTRAEREGPHVRLWGQDGVFLAEITLSDQKVMARLLETLGNAGHLT